MANNLKIQRKSVKDNLIGAKLAIADNALLGSYDSKCNYFISPKIQEELVHIKKYKKTTFGNSLFCVAHHVAYGELVFEITYDKYVEENFSVATLYLLENEVKINGYLQNTIKTKICDYSDLIVDFIEKSYEFYNVEIDYDEAKDKKVSADVFIDMYIASKKQYERAIDAICDKKIADLHEKYFNKRMAVLQKMNNPFATQVLEIFNKEHELIDNIFLRDNKDFESLNMLLDKAIEQVSYHSRAGQLYGWYKPTTSIAEMIHDKYDFYYDSWYQRLFAINSIAIEAEPNTIFYIKDTSSDAYKRYQIGQTGYLKIIDEDFSIDGIYCLGIHLMEKPKITVKDDNKQEVEIYQYQRTKDFEYEDLFTTHYYNNIDEIRNPVKNGVYCVKNVDNIPFVQEGYSLDNNYFSQLQTMLIPSEDLGTKDKLYRVIYYKDNWYLFSRTDDVIMPCQALVDYYYEFEKGKYNKNV